MRIIHNETIETVPAIGEVEFEPLQRSQQLTGWHANRTHSQRFAFEAEGREYWGEIVRLFDRTGTPGSRTSYFVDLMTRNSRTGFGQAVAEAHKRPWRAALLSAFRNHIEASLATL